MVTSAGALVDGLHAIGAKKVSILAPYMKPLTQLVIDYIEHEGIEVVDSISLEIADNLDVGRQDPRAPIEITRRLKTAGVDAIVASACVQIGPTVISWRFQGPTIHRAAVASRCRLARSAVSASVRARFFRVS